ncbi:PRTRC system protein B (plasmid) [Burkholderia ambifaria]|uniref:PRTRC system protein B n=1 Tax=Burkholderia ambifaria TaxID=152480 RepID=UPI001E54092D|nr:PRTRC system protein B [Burkholderia ambifaria]UEP39701.1 PRTRC system protein B [Burkholderia ambifaria]
MSDLATSDALRAVKLDSAILFYTGRSGLQYATVHEVAHDRDGRPLIGAGRPVNRNALLGALIQLDRNAAPKSEFLPSNVLGVSSTGVTWWSPPAMRRVFFDCKELGVRSAVVPHPGLVFQASQSGFRVFAVKTADRPCADTPLFEPPYFNTWDGGQICIGTAQVPTRVEVTSISGWEAGFFESAFTHPNQGLDRVKYKRGVFALWRDMLDGKFGETFPLKVLVPTSRTAGKLVRGEIGDAA